jgi:ABC-type sulfate/molybdate transport systems ATPase subunit
MLSLRSITLVYDGLPALERIDLELDNGEHLALVGPSGSGKTSLLRIIAGLETPREGQLDIQGTTCSSPDILISPGSRGVGFVFQRPALWPHLSLSSNIGFGLDEPRSTEGRRRLEFLIRRLGLEGLEKRKPHQLSGGEARRVSLGRALALEPGILLLDEVFAGLDAQLRAVIVQVLKDEAEEHQTTIIMVTHHLSEARKICPRVAEIRAGRLVFDGSWDDFDCWKDEG